MPAIDLNIDTKEVDFSLIDIEKEIRFANYQVVTNNAKRQLYGYVKDFPHRTGNLRSGALPIWKHLGLPGRPFTKLDTGEKLVTIEKDGKRRTYRVRSDGEFDDNRLDIENPSFVYRIYAAEYRQKYQRYSINKAMRSGLLSPAQLNTVRNMLSGGANLASVWELIEDALKGKSSSITKNNPGGTWRPYQQYFKGNHKTIKAPASQKWTWGNYHKRILEKHSGR